MSLKNNGGIYSSTFLYRLYSRNIINNTHVITVFYLIIFLFLLITIKSTSAQETLKTKKNKTNNKITVRQIETPPQKSSIPEFKYINSNYDLFITINPEKLLKDLSISSTIKTFINSINKTGIKNISSIKKILLFISYGRHKKGNINFIALIYTPPEFDYDKLLNILTSLINGSAETDGLFKTGIYDFKTVFRYYNLAGFFYKNKIILSSASGLKNIFNNIKTPPTENLSMQKDFIDECTEALKENSSSFFTAVIGRNFLKDMLDYLDENEFIYKTILKNAAYASLAIKENSLKISVKLKDADEAKTFKKDFNAQTKKSLEESAETLAEVDVIEIENGDKKMTRFAIRELAYTRKLLKFIIAMNKTAAAETNSNIVFINFSPAQNILKSVDELICAHIDSWEIITRLFLSSEAGCERNAKLLETAALLYLAGFPDKKNTITVENLYENDFIKGILKCPAGGDYTINVNEKNKILINCNIHKK